MTNLLQSVTSASLEDVRLFAHSCSQFIQKKKQPLCFFLWGDLGVGKTTWVKSTLHHFLPEETITSPTFSLINLYQTPCALTFVHADLYRLKSLDELEEIGLLEHVYNDICFIEWPEKIKNLPLPHVVEIFFSYDAKGYHWHVSEKSSLSQS